MPSGRIIPLFAATSLVLAATMVSGSGESSLWSTNLIVADLVLNVALFVPLGMAAKKAGFGTSLTTIIAAALSIGIEAAQLTVIGGRTASPWDIVGNSTGALIGVGIPTRLLLIAVVCGWLGSGWLVVPVPPTSGVWWGQIAHRFPSTERYSGTIVSAVINGLEIPDGRFNKSETVRLNTRARSGGLEFRVTATPPTARSSRRAQLVSLADGRGGEIIGLWQRGNRFEITWNSRGTELGLYRGRVLTHPILTGTTESQLTGSQLIHFAVRLTSGRVVVDYSSGEGNDSEDQSYYIRLGPWAGWRLLWPFTIPTPEIATVITWLWSIAAAAGLLIGLGDISKALRRPGG